MNSIKTVFVLAVLGAVAYGVYVSINNNGQLTPPPGVDSQWGGPVDIRVPELGSTAPPFTGPPAIVGADLGSPGYASGQLSAGATAPPYSASVPPMAGMANSMPPAYPSPSTLDSHSVAPNAGFPPLPGDVSGFDAPAPGAGFTAPSPGVAEAIQSGRPSFDRIMQSAKAQLDEGSLAAALATLSQLYKDPILTPDQSRQITALLDQVAGTVIYSRHHLLEQPHQVRIGETLDQIARSYDVPTELLAKINGIRDPNNLQPGQELKVVRGPFEAIVDLDACELTLVLHGRYAGRFRVGVGRQLEQLAGDYVVKDKTVSSASPVQGDRWIGLANASGNNIGPAVGIHATSNPQDIGSVTASGSISLGGHDIDDVYDILSVGSRVVIRR